MLEFTEIKAKDNRLIKLTTLLQKSSKARNGNRLFVLEGLRICKDAALCGVEFDTLIVSGKTTNKSLMYSLKEYIKKTMC